MRTNTIAVVLDGDDDRDDGTTPGRYRSRLDRHWSQLPVQDHDVLGPNTAIQYIRRPHGTWTERTVHHGKLLDA